MRIVGFITMLGRNDCGGEERLLFARVMQMQTQGFEEAGHGVFESERVIPLPLAEYSQDRRRMLESELLS